jgi:hypothetical protein
VADLESFGRWTQEEEFPKPLRVSFIDGVLWIDRTMEPFYTHNQVKGTVNRVLASLVFSTQQGLWVPDGMQLSNPAANIRTVPDGLFVTYASLRAGRVVRVAGRQTGVVELEGSPEMVLEVVSESSVPKDMVDLPPTLSPGRHQ